MLIKDQFEVPVPIDKVWALFQDVPQVAACLPGADLDQEIAPDQYEGTVSVRMGPVKMEFAGQATIRERDDVTKTLVVDAAGADEKGRGQAALGMTARLFPTATGTRVEVEQDLQLSGAAAQFGRGMVSDVAAVLIRDFAGNVQTRIAALERGLTPEQIAAARPASGFMVGLRAAWMALARVARRFFLPYQPDRV